MSATLNRRHFLALSAAALIPLSGSAQTPLGTDMAPIFVWRGSGRTFGGFSAIHLYPNGYDFLALSDRAFLYTGRLRRDRDERITGVQVHSIHQLRHDDGTFLSGPRGDSEGIALAPDGTIYISFEGGRRTRVAAYETPDAPARILPRHPDFREMPGNGALEALAIDAHGRLYTLPEESPTNSFPLYRFEGNRWHIIGHVPKRDGFAPVGADFGPDGNLYLLERRFRIPSFATRISRLRPDRWNQPETLIETAPGTLDNHEGISMTINRDGRLRATIISDDNRFFLQRTEIVEFLLD
ncbi:MAG: esterase-like activity of phytase family protein [Pararhodobacter sp.]|nr:esterase-like activity of phytase family protein [Pararhodobacter sp.]